MDPETGCIHRRNQVFAKISRPEVAAHFMKPAPKTMVDDLLNKGLITDQEAHLAQFVSVAEDIIVEADSGGHTDNQALTALFPSIVQLRDSIVKAHGLTRPIHLGAAGGLGDPQGVASAFAMGADFVLTGSVNQGCVESGLDSSGKKLLAQVQLGDVTMAPAADMFELGVEVQVLKRGSLFAQRAHKLYALYRQYNSLWDIPQSERKPLEDNILRATLETAWENTASYWMQRDEQELQRALQNPKHQMALVFRSYLGLSSRWAIQGLAERKLDYQIWCGPAMAAFNAWVKDSFLEQPEHRNASQVGRNLLEGACQILRAQQLRTAGVSIPATAFVTKPKYWSE
jgi:PfaD family protein